MNRVIIQGFAKINLALDVLGKRDDGYHEVVMVMQTINWADTLILERRQQGIFLETDQPLLPGDPSNLAYRAAALVQEYSGVKEGVHIRLEKRIPMAAGLAGGSADAAAVLRGLNRLWNLDFSGEMLEELGARLGSDVPFCIRGGTARAFGRGEKLKDLPEMPECWIVLAKPAIDVPTPWVYRNYRGEAVSRHPDIPRMEQMLAEKNLSGVAGEMENVLESVTVAAHPEIARIKSLMKELGVMASLMSGSGPTVFGITENEDAAGYVAKKLREQQVGEVFVAKPVGKMGEDNGS